MEQKRTLWTIAAVGVFLLVILGAALILYSPSERQKPLTASLEPVSKSVSDGWVNPPTEKKVESPVSGLTEEPVDTQNSVKKQSGTEPIRTDSMTVITGTANVYGITPVAANPANTTTIDLNTLKSADAAPAPGGSQESSSSDKTDTVQPIQNTVTTNIIANIQPETTPKNANTERPPVKPPIVKQTSSVSKKKTSIAKKNKATVKSVAKKTSRTLPPTYWVQAASFTVKSSADNAREKLDENKISSEVFTYKDKKGNLYYRVRVGPYTTKSEAEYWQNRIIQIKEFSNTSSYITDSSAAK